MMFLALTLIASMAFVTFIAIALCIQSGRDSRAEESLTDDQIAEALSRAMERELTFTRIWGAAE